MIALRVLPKADTTGALVGELQGKEIVRTEAIAVASLEGGLASGKASVAFVFDLPDGRVVFAETSLALLLTAARALRGAHGVDESGEPLNPVGSGKPAN